MKTFIIIALLIIGAGWFVVSSYQGAHDNTVTLQAAPGNSIVQMFDTMFASAKVIRTLPDGSSCSLVDGPWKTSDSGITMSFYKLTCDNTTGYVNAKWVR